VCVKIGLMLPVAETDRGTMRRYREIRDDALAAERDRFDAIWLADHLLFEWENQPRRGVWESWTLLSALAEATERVEIGALVVCTAFRNPALLAKMADALDEVSDGRLILGLGAGWHEPEFRAFGYPFDHLASRFEDALRIIAPLMRTGAVDYSGKYEQAVDAVSLPRGPRSSGPPILVGASRPRMLRLTAELADAWNTNWLGRAAELPDRLAPMRAACAEVGREPDSLALTVGQIVTFPGLADEEDIRGGSERFMFNAPDELAAEWRNFATQGVEHMIVWPTPYDSQCLERVTTALRIYRDGTDA
jgi:alkanesulfonate monooxygenase SsuD/methylene tetrahydromethanopterin reductase-like flavin-dependent oxidoreductase (luciferase family)